MMTTRRGLMGMVAALALAGFMGVRADSTAAKARTQPGCVCCGNACACPACTCDAKAKAGGACACCGGAACCPATAATAACCR